MHATDHILDTVTNTAPFELAGPPGEHQIGAAGSGPVRSAEQMAVDELYMIHTRNRRLNEMRVTPNLQ